MPKHQKYSPKHRQKPAAGVPKKALRNTVLLSSVALTATGVAVGGGVVSAPDEDSAVGGAVATVASDLGALNPLPEAEAEAAPRRDKQVSRSDRRDAADPAKEIALSVSASSGDAITRTEDLSDDAPRDIGRALLSEFGFGADQFGCLDSLYESESGWRIDADNPTSSAYGIPQALTQTHDLPDGYLTSAEIQIRWGLGYIQDRYGTPCNAWGFKQGNGWY